MFGVYVYVHEYEYEDVYVYVHMLCLCTFVASGAQVSDVLRASARVRLCVDCERV